MMMTASLLPSWNGIRWKKPFELINEDFLFHKIVTKHSTVRMLCITIKDKI